MVSMAEYGHSSSWLSGLSWLKAGYYTALPVSWHWLRLADEAEYCSQYSGTYRQATGTVGRLAGSACTGLAAVAGPSICDGT
jgi:hypothetical protein